MKQGLALIIGLLVIVLVGAIWYDAARKSAVKSLPWGAMWGRKMQRAQPPANVRDYTMMMGQPDYPMQPAVQVFDQSYPFGGGYSYAAEINRP